LGQVSISTLETVDPREALGKLTDLDEQWGKRICKVAPRLAAWLDQL
jgi:hypothetical protein